MSKQFAKSFILASASPRRKKLLAEAGYDFEVVVSDVDESAFESEGVSSVEHTKQLAFAKAMEVAKRNPSRLVLGADTVVDFDGEIIGKPDDAEHAEEITRMLFSGVHKVITGVAIVGIAEAVEIVRAEITTVYPRKLNSEQIAEHIAGGDWQGKAGAYGIQESGDEFVERIEGSFTNVIGLPMKLVEKLFSELNVLKRQKNSKNS